MQDQFVKFEEKGKMRPVFSLLSSYCYSIVLALIYKAQRITNPLAVCKKYFRNNVTYYIFFSVLGLSEFDRNRKNYILVCLIV